MKPCNRCGEEKLPGAFYASMPRCNTCAACIRAAQTARNHKRMVNERQQREYAKAAIAGRITA